MLAQNKAPASFSGRFNKQYICHELFLNFKHHLRKNRFIYLEFGTNHKSISLKQRRSNQSVCVLGGRGRGGGVGGGGGQVVRGKNL